MNSHQERRGSACRGARQIRASKERAWHSSFRTFRVGVGWDELSSDELYHRLVSIPAEAIYPVCA